jgi:multidrug efflux pump
VGAGAEMRRTLGTAVFAGMLGVTLFGIFLTPVFYYVIQWCEELRARLMPADDSADLPGANPPGRRRWSLLQILGLRT